VCPSGGFECWGCRGQTEDANLPAFIELLEQKGFSWDFIKQRIRTFVGLKTPDLESLRRALEVEKV
jgi:hypothetical protein